MSVAVHNTDVEGCIRSHGMRLSASCESIVDTLEHKRFPVSPRPSHVRMVEALDPMGPKEAGHSPASIPRLLAHISFEEARLRSALRLCSNSRAENCHGKTWRSRKLKIPTELPCRCMAAVGCYRRSRATAGRAFPRTLRGTIGEAPNTERRCAALSRRSRIDLGSCGVATGLASLSLSDSVDCSVCP